MIRHTLSYDYTEDDNDPDAYRFYDRLIELLNTVTEHANDVNQGLAIEYDDDLEMVSLRRKWL
ncbi:MAG: hypothetical protein CFH41_00421 [Alphaproteobacteria bacterium MarineAlpha11_Bin1]|nr:MAG: hypothetical protein CFH41_00421 [Alphaproteobacteria bacterium MarineAlpha11_Bin1]|tara:strand:+ start:7286 stop:7474 length:189 start_codon:yes stop_codon:yes gene_type:complete